MNERSVVRGLFFVNGGAFFGLAILTGLMIIGAVVYSSSALDTSEAAVVAGIGVVFGGVFVVGNTVVGAAQWMAMRRIVDARFQGLPVAAAFGGLAWSGVAAVANMVVTGPCLCVYLVPLITSSMTMMAYVATREGGIDGR